MIASLPMYETDRNRAAHDRFWAAIRAAFPGPLPEALTRGADVWQTWRSPDLILSQTCGLPFRARLKGRVKLVGTPDYGLPGAPPGHNYSVIVVGADDPRTRLEDFESAVWAVNDGLSQSGWAAPVAHLATLGLAPISRGIVTGSHRASAAAVMRGKADIAALDAVTWRILQAGGELGALKEIGRTSPTPGLPLITGLNSDARSLTDAVRKAIETTGGKDKSALGGMQDVIEISQNAYLALPLPPEVPSDWSHFG